MCVFLVDYLMIDKNNYLEKRNRFYELIDNFQYLTNNKVIETINGFTLTLLKTIGNTICTIEARGDEMLIRRLLSDMRSHYGR